MARTFLFGSAPLFSKLTTRHLLPPSAAVVASAMSDHHPSLEVIGGGCHQFIPAFKTLNRSYNPFPLVASNRHVETIFASFFRRTPDVKLRREVLRVEGDGAVSLDWISGRDFPPDAPLLILLPGLTGGSQDSYVRHMLLKATSKGFRAVVFNSRGCGDSPVTTPQFYSASFIGDMHEVVRHVSTKYPKANLYAVGWSLGGNILVNYLGRDSQASRFSGAVSLCNPFDLVGADENFHKGFNNVYDKALAKSLRKIFKKHALLFEDIGGEFNIPLAANCKTVREYDDGITRVSFGFKSVDEYYANSSSSDAIKDVRVPLLCIQAENDPIAPSKGIPRQDIKENPNCMLIVTPKGGHLGWIADTLLGEPWTDTPVMDFLEYLEGSASKTYNDPESAQHAQALGV